MEEKGWNSEGGVEEGRGKQTGETGEECYSAVKFGLSVPHQVRI